MNHLDRFCSRLLLAVLLIAVLAACDTTVRFRAVRFLPVSPSLEGDATQVTAIPERHAEDLRIARDGVRVQTQLSSAFAPVHVNPGVYLTLLVTNETETALRIDPRPMRFSRFPPNQRPRPEGAPLEYLSVEPGVQSGGVWTIAPHTVAKVHLVFRSPARTPGYLDFILQRADTGEDYAYCFKVKRVHAWRH